MDKTVQKYLDKANSVWRELAHMFWSSHRRTMVRRFLQYLVVTATLFYYSKNIVSASIRTALGGSL